MKPTITLRNSVAYVALLWIMAVAWATITLWLIRLPKHFEVAVTGIVIFIVFEICIVASAICSVISKVRITEDAITIKTPWGPTVQWKEIESWWWFNGRQGYYRTIAFRTKAGRTLVIPTRFCFSQARRAKVSVEFERHCGPKSLPKDTPLGTRF